MKFLSAIILALSISTAFAEEIAFIPYKVDVPSKDFPVSLGAEYAKLLATGALIAGMEVHSPRELETDLLRNSIDPQGTVSAEELSSLGKSRLIDLFVVGTLYKSKSGYAAESVLFSVKKANVIGRVKVSAPELVELGERELASLFPGKARFPEKLPIRKMDIVFVFDCSYAVASEWEGMKKGIADLSARMTGNWNTDSRVSLIPFSNSHGLEHASRTLKNAFSLARALDNLSPKGSGSEKAIEKAFTDAVRNMSWRADAFKQVVLIVNTPFSRNNRLQNIALVARRKNIVVHTIALGGIYGEQREALAELSSTGGGRHFDVAYHKKLFDVSGEEIHLYLESGRLFTSNGYDGRWKDGLFIARQGGPASARPKPFLKEIFFDEKKSSPSPMKMAGLFEQHAKTHVIREEDATNNIARLMSMLGGKISWAGYKESTSLGRVLVYQDTYSLWLDVARPEDLDFFRKKVKSGEVFSLGVSIEEKRDEPFGIRFNPRRYITGVPSDYLPELLKVRIENFVKEKAHYSSHGLFEPPIWFVELKAERVKFHKGSDVRDE